MEKAHQKFKTSSSPLICEINSVQHLFLSSTKPYLFAIESSHMSQECFTQILMSHAFYNAPRVFFFSLSPNFVVFVVVTARYHSSITVSMVLHVNHVHTTFHHHHLTLLHNFQHRNVYIPNRCDNLIV